MANTNNITLEISVDSVDLVIRRKRKIKYSDQLERWEQDAYAGQYGEDWLVDVGEWVKFYAMECETQGKQPSFSGLMKYLERKHNLGKG